MISAIFLQDPRSMISLQHFNITEVNRSRIFHSFRPEPNNFRSYATAIFNHDFRIWSCSFFEFRSYIHPHSLKQVNLKRVPSKYLVFIWISTQHVQCTTHSSQTYIEILYLDIIHLWLGNYLLIFIGEG